MAGEGWSIIGVYVNNECDCVFATPSGKHLDPGGVRVHLKQLLVKAGLPDKPVS